MKKLLVFLCLSATIASGLTLDDTPLETGMWSVGDPFGFTTLSNANARSTANAAWLGTNTTHIAANSNQIVVAKAWITALSNDVDVVKSNATTLSNGLASANAKITVNSNRTEQVNGYLANYLPLAGGTMELDADILLQTQYWFLTLGSVGIGGSPGFYYDAGPFGNYYAYLPTDESGDLTLATREWFTTQLGGYLPLAGGRITSDIIFEYSPSKVNGLKGLDTFDNPAGIALNDFGGLSPYDYNTTVSIGHSVDSNYSLDVWGGINTDYLYLNGTNLQTTLAGKVDTNHTGNVTLNNDLSVGGALSVTGLATFGTNATSSVDYLTTTPSARDLVTAEWVRGLAMSGAEWYFTSTVTNGFGEKTANLVALSDMIPATAFTNQVASPVGANVYLVGGVTTNVYTSLRSPVTLDAYLSRQGGNTSTVIPVHPEIYYVYNGTTNQLGDWEVANQNVTSTSPTRFTWVVAFPEPAITGSVRVVAYMKSGTPTGTASGLNIYGGGIYSSHLDIQNIGVMAESDPIWSNEKSGYVQTNDSRVVNAITNGQSGITIAGTTNLNNLTLFSSEVKALDTASGEYIKFGAVNVGAYVIKGMYQNNPNRWVFFGVGNETYFVAKGSLYFETDGLYPLVITKTKTTHDVALSEFNGNLTVTGISKIILPTSTNGLTSGILWNNAGTVSVMP